ncbi:HAD family hydrolase [Salinactinospora qingdaonensis]
MEALDAVIPLDEISAVIFDMDGVVTDTAFVHAAAWKRTFDEFLRSRAKTTGGRFRPFELREDYLRFVEGRPLPEGVRAFLTSRGIALPESPPEVDPGATTITSLGDRKDGYFLDYVRHFGVASFPSTMPLIRELRRGGAATAIVSTSSNCAAILCAAGVAHLFDVNVDGREAVKLGLSGSPTPDLLLEATRRLGVAPTVTAVVEDDPAGVEAGARGGFGLLVGVDRSGQEAELYRHGAHIVVSDLAELRITGTREPTVRGGNGHHKASDF